MRLRSSILGFLLVLSVGCWRQVHNDLGNVCQDPDYEIYDAVLAEALKGVPDGSVAVQRTTLTEIYPRVSPDKQKWVEAAANQRLRNTGSKELHYCFRTTNKVVLMDRAEFFSLVRGIGPDAWEPLSKKYPGCAAYIAFSSVGYSDDRKTAIVFVEAGNVGKYSAILEKRDAKWYVVAKGWAEIA